MYLVSPFILYRCEVWRKKFLLFFSLPSSAVKKNLFCCARFNFVCWWTSEFFTYILFGMWRCRARSGQVGSLWSGRQLAQQWHVICVVLRHSSLPAHVWPSCTPPPPRGQRFCRPARISQQRILITHTQTRTWNYNTFARYLYGAVVLTAPYGLPVTHHCASFNGAINL
jgi:hypothetical protein